MGLVKVRSFRPFPSEELRQALGRAGVVAVFDRALSFGSQGILATEVKMALYDAPHRPLVQGLMAGFGGREVNLDTVRGIVERARRADGKDNVVRPSRYGGQRRRQRAARPATSVDRRQSNPANWRIPGQPDRGRRRQSGLSF